MRVSARASPMPIQQVEASAATLRRRRNDMAEPPMSAASPVPPQSSPYGPDTSWSGRPARFKEGARITSDHVAVVGPQGLAICRIGKKTTPGRVMAGLASLLQPNRPFPACRSWTPATPRPEQCRGGQRGSSNPVEAFSTSSRLPRSTVPADPRDPDRVLLVDPYWQHALRDALIQINSESCLNLDRS